MLWPNPSDQTWKYPLFTIPTKDEPSMWMAWLIRLRWLAVSAQAVVIAFSLDVIDRPAITVSLMVLIMVGLIVANHIQLRRLESGEPIPRVTMFNHLWLDLSALTAMLFLTGGAANPFVMLYVVHVTLGAMVLRGEGAAALMIASLAAFGLLHINPLPLHLDHHPMLSANTLYTIGQTVAFAATVGSVGGFVLGMSASMRRREEQLRAARARLGEPMTEQVVHPATGDVLVPKHPY